jgi:hypothetical protein
MRGWRSLADLAWRRMGAMPEGSSLAADDREVMAELDFYTRGRPFPLVMAVGNGPPGNGYELNDRVTAESGQSVLLIARFPDRHDILDHFARHQVVEDWTIGAGRGRLRRYTVYQASGWQAPGGRASPAPASGGTGG